MIDIKLKNLGYNDFFDLNRKSLNLETSTIARVTSEQKGTYVVKNTVGQYTAKITGKQMFNASKREDYPAVGDWVVITFHDKEKAIIQSVLPRKTILKKKYSFKSEIQIIATNIDAAFIVESLDRDYNLNRFERYFVLAYEEGITPVIVLNKIDLVKEAELNKRVAQIKDRFNNIDVILTSIVTKEGIFKLLNYIKQGKTYCFIGSSGVGKSSLINKLLQNDVIKTQEISDYSFRGKHTTTKRDMYFLDNGGIVIDNPGTREVGLGDVGGGIENVFDEISMLSKDCKFSDCTHTHEKSCAVLKAVKDGALDKAKYENYIKLRKESKFYDMTHVEKRDKNRKFGKFIKKAKKELRK